MNELERLRAQVAAVEGCLGCTLRGCGCGQERKWVYTAEIRAALAVGGGESPNVTPTEPTRCRAEHPSNPTVVPCCLEPCHDSEHVSTTGCAGSVMRWAVSPSVDPATEAGAR